MRQSIFAIGPQSRWHAICHLYERRQT